MVFLRTRGGGGELNKCCFNLPWRLDGFSTGVPQLVKQPAVVFQSPLEIRWFFYDRGPSGQLYGDPVSISLGD